MPMAPLPYIVCPTLSCAEPRDEGGTAGTRCKGGTPAKLGSDFWLSELHHLHRNKCRCLTKTNTHITPGCQCQACWHELFSKIDLQVDTSTKMGSTISILQHEVAPGLVGAGLGAGTWVCHVHKGLGD